MIFYTPSAMHLKSSIALPYGNVNFKQFSDKELYVHILEPLEKIKPPVWVIAATQPPSDHLFELFFLLNALQRYNINPHVLITYFGYARQHRAQPGESLSAQVISNFLKTFNLQSLSIIHAHNPEIRNFISFQNIIPYDFFYSHAQHVDTIVAPDYGAFELACAIAQKTNKQSAYIEKIRENHDQSKVVSFTGDVKNKKILIVDDIISTGHTIVNAAHTLQRHGASEIHAAATHGIFSGNALTLLKESPLQSIVATNTLEQRHSSSFIKVFDIGPFLKSFIQSHSYE